MLLAPFRNGYEIFRQAHENHEPVIFMTDTIYGIGAPVTDIEANRKIYNIKGREKNKPFPILVASYEQAFELANISDRNSKIIKNLWPGPYTFILNAKPHVDGIFTHNGNIAVRMSADKIIAGLITETGPLSATSANLSGVLYNPDIKIIMDSFKSMVKYYVIRRSENTSSSTIIDLTSDTPKLVRGEINLHEIIHYAIK